MANYNATSRTNYFRVTDEDRYKELYSGLDDGFGSIVDFTEKKDDGIWHGFGGEGSIDWYDDDDGDADPNIDYFFDELQKILDPRDAFVLMEVGYEKLRYLVGNAFVMTKDETKSFDIHNDVHAWLEEKMGSDFKTRLEY